MLGRELFKLIDEFVEASNESAKEDIVEIHQQYKINHTEQLNQINKN